MKLGIRRFLGLLISNLKPNITKFKIVNSRNAKVNIVELVEGE